MRETSGPHTETPDAELIRLCVEEGRADSFEELMSRYHGRVYSVVHRLVDDAERAQDLTQETFLKAWRALPRFEGAASFYTWLYRIARNLVSSDFRKERTRPRIAVSLSDGGPGEGAEAPEVADTRPDPREGTLSAERQRAIVDAIRGLIPDFREIIVLRDVEKYAYEEIAEMLELPLGTVRSRLHRARLELKAKLADVLA